MKILSVIFVIGFAKISFADEIKRYDNYQQYRVKINNLEAWNALLKLDVNGIFQIEEDKQMDNFFRIVLPPEVQSVFKTWLVKYDISYELEIENLQSLIDAEKEKHKRLNKHNYGWTLYHPLNEVYSWLHSLQKKYKHVRVFTGGKTYEGRPILGIKITHAPFLPGVVIEAGIHAREWISVAGSSWMINEILKSDEPIWKKFNYIYFPVFNPDGYVHSWTKDRLWRKTRTPYKRGNKTCYGADANRNWDVQWGTVGASKDNPCSLIYAGPRAFSEVETRTLSQFLYREAKIRRNKIYVNYHSYSQMLLFPYGYTAERAPMHDIWKKIGDLAGKAYTSVHGSDIRVGPIFSTVYPVSGTSGDWYYEKLNATLSYSYEMRDQGRYGFILPPDQIIPVGQEQFASLKVILSEYLKHFEPNVS